MSKLLIGRKYTKATIEQHRANMTGIVMSSETRAKMSASYGGVTIYLLDVDTNLITIFQTKVEAAAYLGISMRTLSLANNQIHTIKHLGKTIKVSLSLNSISMP